MAAIEQYVKTELGNKDITWATPYELKNSHCQLSFTCDGLSYDVLVDWTANVCFGGKERNILFITASKSVYTLKMLVHGVTKT